MNSNELSLRIGRFIEFYIRFLKKQTLSTLELLSLTLKINEIRLILYLKTNKKSSAHNFYHFLSQRNVKLIIF